MSAEVDARMREEFAILIAQQPEKTRDEYHQLSDGIKELSFTMFEYGYYAGGKHGVDMACERIGTIASQAITEVANESIAAEVMTEIRKALK